MKLVTKLNDNQIKITFPFNYTTIANIKENVIGRAWEKNGKYWYAPLSLLNLEILKKLGFLFSNELEKLFINNDDICIDVKKLIGISIPTLKRKLYPFQEEGVAFIEKKKGRALIADEMGLGKTIQALAWLELHLTIRPVLIIVPASLKLNWVKEIQITLSNPGQIQMIQGKKLFKITGDIVIINYDILNAWVENINKWNPRIVITDEAHYYKNNKSQRTKAVKKIVRKKEYFIALSGTPITSRPIEFYNVISIISPTLFTNRWYYAMRYCGAKNNGFGWDFSGASNTKELHGLINNVVMIRRKKSDVLKELPVKIRNYIPVEITNRGEYAAASNAFIDWLKENKGVEKAKKAKNAEILVQLSYLKTLAIEGKLRAVKYWIKDFLESTDEKLVVFGIHRFVVDYLMKEFVGISVKIDGSVTGKGKQIAVEKFQKDTDIRLLIGNIKAAGVGITLTTASNILIIELPWSPGELIQAEDRCHRIGQKSAVNINYILAEKTIDMKMVHILDKKRKVIDNILDGIETSSFNLLKDLISSYL